VRWKPNDAERLGPHLGSNSIYQTPFGDALCSNIFDHAINTSIYYTLQQDRSWRFKILRRFLKLYYIYTQKTNTRTLCRVPSSEESKNTYNTKQPSFILKSSFKFLSIINNCYHPLIWTFYPARVQRKEPFSFCGCFYFFFRKPKLQRSLSAVKIIYDGIEIHRQRSR